MATASDDFNRANGGAGADWASVNNALLIDGNGLEGDSAPEREQCIRWAGAGAPFGATQFSEAVLTGIESGLYYYGVAARCSTSAADYYTFYGNADESYLQRFNAGAATQLGSTGAGFPANCTARLEVTGTNPVVLTITVDGAAWTSINAGGVVNDATASRLQSGQVGCSGFARNDGSGRIDSWSGGDLGGGTTTTVTPAQATITVGGLASTVNTFTNVRIREVMINEAGSPIGNATGIRLLVWYGGAPVGAPDLSYSDMTTDANGTTSWSLATGSLVYNQAIFYVANDGSASLSQYTCARMIPTYS